MNFICGVLGGKRTTWLNFGGDVILFRNGNENFAWPAWGAVDNPEALGLVLHHQGPTYLKSYCQAATSLADRNWRLSKQTFVNPGILSVLTSFHTASNMKVMICLGQEGLPATSWIAQRTKPFSWWAENWNKLLTSPNDEHKIHGIGLKAHCIWQRAKLHKWVVEWIIIDQQEKLELITISLYS